MIGFLSGRPQVLKDSLLIIAGGVGYEVHCGHILKSSASTQSEIEAYIYTHIREDAFELYGFQTLQEKELFELVLSVSGVGPKTALAIVDRGPDKLIEAVQQAHVAFFKEVPRVGKKLAQKIIIELGSKLGELKKLELGPRTGKQQDVIDAVTALGFPEDQVEEAVRQLDLEELTLEQAIKHLIKQL